MRPPFLLVVGMAALNLKLAAAGVALVLAFGAGWWLRGLQVKAATVKQTQALAQPCPKLVTLQGATGADVLRWSADTVRKYQLCAAQGGRAAGGLAEAVNASAMVRCTLLTTR